MTDVPDGAEKSTPVCLPLDQLPPEAPYGVLVRLADRGGEVAGGLVGARLVLDFVALDFFALLLPDSGLAAGRSALASPPLRVSFWPGRIRSGSLPTVSRLAS